MTECKNCKCIAKEKDEVFEAGNLITMMFDGIDGVTKHHKEEIEYLRNLIKSKCRGQKDQECPGFKDRTLCSVGGWCLE